MTQSNYLAFAPALTGGQLLDRVLDVEGRLRGLIRRVLSKVKLDWEQLVPGTVRDDLNVVLPKKALHWKGWGQPDVLDCATLAQLIAILNARWRDFSSTLPDKAKLTAKLEECREYRNRLAHAEPLSPDDKVRIYVLVQDLTDMIPGATPSRRVAPPGTTMPLGLNNKQIVWVDDNLAWTRMERRWFEELGANVTPVLSNDEAVAEIGNQQPDLVISDIARDEQEDGAQLGIRLAAAGMNPPILFYVSRVDRQKPLPAGGVGITSDPAELLRDALEILKPRH